MSVNVAAINATIARIRQNQNFSFDMGFWGGDDSEQKYDDNEHPCGTSACLAGFATLASGKAKIKVIEEEFYPSNDEDPIMVKVDVIDFDNIELVGVSSDAGTGTRATVIGRDYLGITAEQAERLFIPDFPSFYAGSIANNDYLYRPDYFHVTADQAIAVLEHLRDTGVVDWRVSGLEPEDARYWDALAEHEPNFQVAI